MMLGSLIRRLLTNQRMSPPEGITTLIPAYKTTFFLELLIGLKSQITPPKRVLISDDSPDGAFKRHIREESVQSVIQGMDIAVIDGPRTGALDNCLHLLKIWNGSTSLAHMHLDDDVIYPDFYTTHIAAHATAKYGCTISRRWTALESGQPFGQLPRPSNIALNPRKLISIDSTTAFASTIPDCNNWLGEMSNVVFSHQISNLFIEANLADIPYTGLGDIGFFLATSLKKPLGYIDTPLGSFRTHREQSTQAPLSHVFKMGVLAWSALAIAATKIGKLKSADAIRSHSRTLGIINSLYPNDYEISIFRRDLEGLIRGEPMATESFIKNWVIFSNKGQASVATATSVESTTAP